jgi:hypothetical protein
VAHLTAAVVDEDHVNEGGREVLDEARVLVLDLVVDQPAVLNGIDVGPVVEWLASEAWEG